MHQAHFLVRADLRQVNIAAKRSAQNPLINAANCTEPSSFLTTNSMETNRFYPLPLLTALLLTASLSALKAQDSTPEQQVVYSCEAMVAPTIESDNISAYYKGLRGKKLVGKLISNVSPTSTNGIPVTAIICLYTPTRPPKTAQRPATGITDLTASTMNRSIRPGWTSC